MSETQISLYVGRSQENRERGEPDDGPLARAAHELRRVALEAALDDPAYRVVSWGKTRDSETHEIVEVIVAILATPVAKAAGIALLGFMGAALEDVFKSIVADAIKDLAGKLYNRVRKKDLNDFEVLARDGSRIIFLDGAIWLEVEGKYSIRFNPNELPKSFTINF